MHKLIPFLKTVRFYDEYHESGQIVIIMPRKASGREKAQFLKWAGLDWQGVNISSEYDCTGQYFSRPPVVRKSNSRVLITQSWGIDL